jgi:hypothetical protein
VLVDQDRLHQLKEDAKWASSIEGQIRAVKELGTLGEVALPSLEEVLQVSVRDEIKQCCTEAIRNLGRNIRAEAGTAKKKSPAARKARRRGSAR